MKVEKIGPIKLLEILDNASEIIYRENIGTVVENEYFHGIFEYVCPFCNSSVVIKIISETEDDMDFISWSYPNYCPQCGENQVSKDSNVIQWR